MKIRGNTLVLVAGLLAGLAHGTALADGVIQVTASSDAKYNGMIINRLSGDVGGLGGLGLSDTSGVAGQGAFYSFCIERNEIFEYNTTYQAQIATSAADGGIAGGSPDAISGVTALIYRQFRSGPGDVSSPLFGGVGSFGAGYSTAFQTLSIQLALWYAEQEMATFNTSELAAYSYSAAAKVGIMNDAQAIFNWAQANSTGALRGVRVLRLWDDFDPSLGYYGNRQDVLTIIPLPPSAYAGLGTLGALMGLAHLRRRKNDAE